MSLSRFRVLRNSGFRRLWLAGWLSMFGSEASAIAVFLYLFRSSNSVLDLAFITALRTLPAGLIAPLAGVVVDRVDKRNLMIAADLARIALLAGLIAFPSKLFLYAMSVLSSLAGAFFEPARSASIPALVEKDEIAEANGLDQMMWNLMIIGGPLAGALLFARAGLSVALALDAVSFLVSALLLLRIASPPSAPARAVHDAVQPSPWFDVRAGWAYLRANPALLQIALLWFLSTLAVGMWAPLAPFFNRDALGGADETLGYQLMVFGTGGAIGGVAAGVACRYFKPGRLLVAAMLLEGFHLFLFSRAAGVWSSVFVLLPWGFVVATIFVVAQSLLQTMAAPEMLGRVLSTVRQGENIGLLGAMAAAVFLSRLFSVRAIFAFAGLFYIAVIAASCSTRGGRALLAAKKLPAAGDMVSKPEQLFPVTAE